MKKQVLSAWAFFLATSCLVSPAKADTDILKAEDGYKKITEMPKDLNNYYFVIVDKDQDLMMTLDKGSNQGGDYKTWWYRTSTDPSMDFNKVWTIENNDEANGHTTGYAFRNLNDPTFLMQTEWNAPWYFRTHDQPQPCEWTQFLFTYQEDGSWTFENGKYPLDSNTGGGYIGAWSEKIENGAETAANKSNQAIGKFIIYSITKQDFNQIKKKQALEQITSEYQSVKEHSTADEKVTETYEKALNTATGTISNSTSLDEISNALSNLEQARQDYVLAATPDKGFPFDYTFLIAEANASNNGWTKTYGPVIGGAQDNYGIQTSTNKNNGDLISDHYLETWTPADVNGQHNMYSTGQMYYTAHNLPAGYYKVTAYTFDASKSDKVDFFVNTHKDHLDANTDLFTLSYIEDVKIEPNTDTKIGLEITESGKTQWIGITNIKLAYLGPLTTEDALAIAREALRKAITEADNITDTNVGEEAFQIPTIAFDALGNAIVEANHALNEAQALETLEAAMKKLNTATSDYKNAILNQPQDGETFNVIMSYAGYRHDGKALTFMADARSDMGNYNLDLRFPPNKNYAQQLIFTPVEVKGKNNVYTISTIDPDGNERYICTGTIYGGSNVQIRTTLNKEEALNIQVFPTETENVYNLFNLEANDWLGCQDDTDDKCGFYTTSAHNTLAIKKADTPSIELATPIGWATLILPFTANKPEGLTVYTCTSTEEKDNATYLVLEETENLKANCPYIVNANYKFSCIFKGLGSATKDSYSNDMMTGTYTQMKALDGTYVLQKQDVQTGFFKVVSGQEPTIGAYRAYMDATVAETNVKGLILPGTGGTTHIDGRLNEEAEVNVYDLNGILVRKNVKLNHALKGLQKGIYIVNGIKKTVK